MNPPLEMTRRTWLKAGAATIGLSAATRLDARAGLSSLALPAVQAVASDSLVDIMGVRTALALANSSLYGNLELVKAAMRADTEGLGLRHIREAIVLPGINKTMAANQRNAWGQLAELGVEVTCGLGDPDDRDGTVAAMATYIKSQLGGNAGYVAAVENSNEPNSPKKAWNISQPDNWVGLVRRRQAQMATAFRNDSALNQIRLAGPPLVGGAGLKKYEALGDLSPNVDVGNFHFYGGAREQSTPSAELDRILQGVKIYAPGKPVYCTETGMHQAPNSLSGITYHPEWVAGVYMPRVPLEHYYRGVGRVCAFELLDDYANPTLNDETAHYGLLRYNTTSMEPKPAYNSLKRLLDLLRDPGATFTPGSLAMQVSNAPAGYRQLLFEKSDGRRYLCMWRDVSIWDQLRNIEINVAAVDVRVDMALPTAINVFRPASQTTPVTTYSNVTSVTIPLAGEVNVLEIIGVSAPI